MSENERKLTILLINPNNEVNTVKNAVDTYNPQKLCSLHKKKINNTLLYIWDYNLTPEMIKEKTTKNIDFIGIMYDNKHAIIYMLNNQDTQAYINVSQKIINEKYTIKNKPLEILLKPDYKDKEILKKHPEILTRENLKETLQELTKITRHTHY